MHILVRFAGDIATKASQTRQRFTRCLVENIEDAFRTEGISFEIDRRWGRIFIETPSNEATEVLQRVYGVQSFSVVDRRPASTLSQVVTAGEKRFRDHVSGKTFAVRARRGGDKSQIPFTSKDIENELGAALLPYAREVDLDHPDRVAYVEVRGDQAYFFTEKVAGPSGMPLGVDDRAIALVSGGFDSVVAAWYMLRRGVALDYVFCQLGSSVHLRRSLHVFKQLSDRWSYGDRPRLNVLDFRPVVEELRARTKTRYWQLLLKRMMYRAAGQIARITGRKGIVTGEAIGQVSSQTLQNLTVTSQVVDMPLLRPLVGFSKDEIIQRARALGTYEASAQVSEHCALVSSRPATGASREKVQAEEEKLDLELLAHVVEGREVYDLRALNLEQWEGTNVEIETVPEDATVLDIRPQFAFDAWHYPGAVQMDFNDARQQFDEFEPDETYVICCRVGLKSAHLAERMREAGYEAYSVKGGMKTLMREAVEQDLVSPEALPEEVGDLL